MKILLVAQHYHPVVGGIETEVRLMGQELTSSCQVEIAAVNFSTSKLPRRLTILHPHLLAKPHLSHKDGQVPIHALSPTQMDRLRLLPIAVQVIPGVRRVANDAVREFGYQRYRQIFVPKLRQIMQNVDVVHSVAIDYLGWAAQEAAHGLGIPFICTPHVHPKQWGDDGQNVEFYQRCNAVVALTEGDRENLIALGVSAQQIQVIGICPILPPMADPGQFRDQHGLQDFPIVLFVGRMCEYKGTKAILEATQQIWQHCPETRFVFIGSHTPESAKYFDDSDPRILYLGTISEQEKANAFAACTVFCMPSVNETLGIVYLEAWSYGKPVIGGKAPGLPRFIEGNGGGLTVDQFPENVASIIIHLLQDPQLRHQLGQSGKLLVEQTYSMQAIVNQRQLLYQSLIEHSTAVHCDRDREGITESKNR
ncbi:glycosyltransferase family 1 protein [Phormidesmis priestleyi ULC007]|uniref:Glycosyltransferase family 1 protein n=1 Tax=Phormidesmis priestleyi ULC007 TaxID=1920490 RepID=A0A2T1DNM9_9CYAN|nr:glycosyltransferase family 4 protein [Phormidesmis priestleyi]PSB22024.1 glycosyltransferase family 1 protein [Phormidesmis priestleyi ULC007]PZO55008.1 MAG: glycosyltransferase family 1 protein [Phormidesmis priestleyi]